MRNLTRVVLVLVLAALPLRIAFAAANPDLTVCITCTMATTVILDWGTPAGAPSSANGSGPQTWTIAAATAGAAYTASTGGPTCSLWNGGATAIYVQVGLYSIGTCTDLATYWTNQSASGYPTLDGFQLYFQLANPAGAVANDLAFANGSVAGGSSGVGAAALVYLHNPTISKNKMNPATGQAVDLIFNAPTTVDYSAAGTIVVEFVGTSY